MLLALLPGCSGPAPQTAADVSSATLAAEPTPAAPTATPTRTPGIAYPDPVRTPGDVFPVGKDVICVTGYTRTVRDVSNATKARIYAEYGITRPRLPNEFEMDHLIPLAIGGSNDDRNLWPEPAEPKPGFHEKDQLEVKLLVLVCSGVLSLEEAQRAVASDWYAAYKRYVLQQP